MEQNFKESNDASLIVRDLYKFEGTSTARGRHSYAVFCDQIPESVHHTTQLYCRPEGNFQTPPSSLFSSPSLFSPKRKRKTFQFSAHFIIRRNLYTPSVQRKHSIAPHCSYFSRLFSPSLFYENVIIRGRKEKRRVFLHFLLPFSSRRSFFIPTRHLATGRGFFCPHCEGVCVCAWGK